MSPGAPPRVVLFGAGGWGANHARTLHQLGVLAAVVDPSPTLDLAALGLGAVPHERDASDLGVVSRYGASAAVVATPASTHAELTIALLDAGVDVLVEKPMAMRAEDARRMADAAGRSRRVLLVGHLLLHYPAMACIRAVLAETQLGEIRAVRIVRRNFGRARVVENAMWSLGVHDVAVVHDLVGEAPHHVSATGKHIRRQALADETYVQLAFPGGAVASIESSWLWPTKERSLVITCERGFVTYREGDGEIQVIRKWIDADTAPHDEGTTAIGFTDEPALTLELTHFLRCCADRDLPRIGDAPTGVIVTEVLEAADTALKESVPQ